MRSSSSFESSSHGNFEQRRELFRALLSFFWPQNFQILPQYLVFAVFFRMRVIFVCGNPNFLVFAVVDGAVELAFELVDGDELESGLGGARRE
ncbi:phosphatase subunit g4-1 isoform X3 [Iris pallida]|uniref:Phosphatase subunit g4-1 isoform X3 n=1 Tax=Iris pallida TaxID=29817 RepID=A0AAX6G169_IRIPA|nr:phosphatase subunit g4-1 isoform X3 [Iris pallida]